MRMRLRQLTFSLVWTALVCPVAVAVAAEPQAAPEPAPEVMRFVERAIAWYPDSTFRLVSNIRTAAASGAYRVLEVERNCASKVLAGTATVLVDEVANTIWLGSVGELPPFQDAGAGSEALRGFLSQFLPQALQASMGIRVELEWNIGPRRPGALIPLYLMIESGYGAYRRQAAVTSDGKYLILGSEMPLTEDPVAYRRRTLAESDLVVWDSEPGNKAQLEIIEFSDLECPACKGKWPLVNMVLQKHAGKVRHGMVSYPLTQIHPWAFRAASASWCVGDQDPKALIPFKETFYELQREMEVAQVTPTSTDFVAGQGLDEDAFLSCYLKPPSIDAVHRQMSLGQEMGVRATPTYYLNGWMIQVPDGSWFPALVERLLDGQEP